MMHQREQVYFISEHGPLTKLLQSLLSLASHADALKSVCVGGYSVPGQALHPRSGVAFNCIVRSISLIQLFGAVYLSVCCPLRAPPDNLPGTVVIWSTQCMAIHDHFSFMICCFTDTCPVISHRLKLLMV